MRALRRHMSHDIDNFPRDVAELVNWFDATDPNPPVRPVPGYGEKIPVAARIKFIQCATCSSNGVTFRLCLSFCP